MMYEPLPVRQKPPYILLILFLFTSCSAPSGKIKVTHSDTIRTDNIKWKVISDPTNTLTGKTENLELEYIAWGCACANWITAADFKKCKDSNLAPRCIFIEPATDSLGLQASFDASANTIKVKGQFYLKPDYPKGTLQTEEQPEKAKVFRYTSIELKEKRIDYFQNNSKTLILNYNAIACTCAQWSESKFNNKPEKQELFYLERANNKIIDADSLFNGENLPLQIRVTGQFIKENGYPSGYNFSKGGSKAAKVFRYSEIKVIDNGYKK